MKQIILISRIYKFGDYNEFSIYAEDLQAPFIANIGNGKIGLIIINGLLLNELPTLKEIANKALWYALETDLTTEHPVVIAYHNDQSLQKEFEAALEEYRWNAIKIFKYSGGGKNPKSPLYDILNSIGTTLKAGNSIGGELLTALWVYFTGNPVLERKLNLLHYILSWEGHSELPFEIDNETNQKAINSFLQACPNGYNNNDREHRDALKRLRDILLADHQA